MDFKARDQLYFYNNNTISTKITKYQFIISLLNFLRKKTRSNIFFVINKLLQFFLTYSLYIKRLYNGFYNI